ncbi:MAG: ribbon-helix-helix protein, CopG family [Ferrimicrobium sp.]
MSFMSKSLVSVDEKLLARIDNAARSAGLTRSAHLSRLAERDLGDVFGPEVNRHV